MSFYTFLFKFSKTRICNYYYHHDVRTIELHVVCFGSVSKTQSCLQHYNESLGAWTEFGISTRIVLYVRSARATLYEHPSVVFSRIQKTCSEQRCLNILCVFVTPSRILPSNFVIRYFFFEITMQGIIKLFILFYLYA